MPGAWTIPNEAASIAYSAARKGAIFDLYLRADRRKYKPMKLPTSILRKDWEMPVRQIRALLEDLVDLGLIEWDHGTSRKSQTITVKRPEFYQKAERSREHLRERLPERCDDDQQGNVGDAGTHAGTLGGTQSGNSIPRNHGSTFSTVSEEIPPTPKGANPKKPDPAAALWSRMMEIKHGRSLKLTSARGSALRGRLKDHSAEEILLGYRWWCTSDDEKAIWLRSKHSVDTFLRARNCSGYIEKAAENAPSAAATETGLTALDAWGIVLEHRRATRDQMLARVPASAHKRFTAALSAAGIRWPQVTTAPPHELGMSRASFVGGYRGGA